MLSREIVQIAKDCPAEDFGTLVIKLHTP